LTKYKLFLFCNRTIFLLLLNYFWQWLCVINF
jgi:hypothetical protein